MERTEAAGIPVDIGDPDLVTVPGNVLQSAPEMAQSEGSAADMGMQRDPEHSGCSPPCSSISSNWSTM